MGRGCQESQGRFGALLGALPEPLELLQGPRVSAGFSVPSFRVSIEILRAAEISHLVPSHPCRKGSLSGGGRVLFLGVQGWAASPVPGLLTCSESPLKGLSVPRVEQTLLCLCLHMG